MPALMPGHLLVTMVTIDVDARETKRLGPREMRPRRTLEDKATREAGNPWGSFVRRCRAAPCPWERSIRWSRGLVGRGGRGNFWWWRSWGFS